MLYCADFETTTDINDCRVWAWGITTINNDFKFTYGNDINGFIEFAKNSKNSTFYFHNLKFDGEFIIDWLFRNGFSYTNARKLEEKQFKTLISDKGQFYSITICFERKGSKLNQVNILDSLKILPFKVKEIAKGFNLPISKLEIDYNKFREVGHVLSDEEIKYLKHDLEIPARALKTLFDEGLDAMTQGSNALNDYKKIIGKKTFDRNFPIPYYDSDVRQCYKGGFTYLNPKYKEKDIGEGIVLDVNSLYPSVMYYEKLPYGEGIFFAGEYKPDKVYDVYVQVLRCQFELKDGYIPTIQLKNNLSFMPTQYLSSSKEEEVILYLTSVDLELFLEHYNVYNLEYLSGWKFKSIVGLFKDYIDKWMSIKIESEKEGNKAMRTLAKLMLNALYGKFGLNPDVRSKIPYFDEDRVKYMYGEHERRNPVYIPMACFITAYARKKTIESAQKVFDRFVYADTDSLHLIGLEIPSELEVDKYKLGAWKHESSFKRARFLRQKSYIEEEEVTEEEMNKMIEDDIPKENFYLVDGELRYLKITCAGMPSDCYQYVTWDNFKTLQKYEGKKQQKHVKGGIVLVDTEFTIKRG